jgi:16S rRNA (guanine(527)-N(7))-methyltransferase RsmG
MSNDPSPTAFSGLNQAIGARFPELQADQVSRAVRFAELMNQENEVQNVTRIVGADSFVDGHLVDVVELFRFEQSCPGLLGSVMADVGSGSGVPGLLAAALDTQPGRSWHLIESEQSKAEYLLRSAQTIGLSQVHVHAMRAEAAIKAVGPSSVMARAVGTVDKIAAWIWNCSTWNNLVLFKSRGWKEEWEKARLTKIGKKLTVTHTHEYSTEGKYRIIVKMSRA